MDLKKNPLGRHNNFTLIRYLLAAWLLMGHFNALVSEKIATSGAHYYHDHFRVYAFFVISGFLVAASLDRRKDYKNFYLRRFFRIYPAYAFVIIVQAIIMLFILGDFGSHQYDTGHYVVTNLMFANFLNYSIGDVFDHLYNPGINPSLWTLKIEIGFYLILPVLWIFVRKYGMYFLLGVYIASTIYTLALMDTHETLSRQLPGQLRYFIVGIAFYFYRDKIKLGWKSALAISIALMFTFKFTEYDIVIVLYPVIVGTIIFLLAMKMPAVPIRYDITYGLYLFHAPVLQLSNYYGLIEYDRASFIFIAVVTVVLAVIANILLERPAMKIGKKVAQKLGWQIPKSPKEAHAEKQS